MQQFLTFGDLRPGSISAVSRRCGKPTSQCAKPDDPSHDAQLRLAWKVNGKSEAESFPTPATFHNAQREVDEFHRLQNLVAQLISVNNWICAQQKVERQQAGWTPQEKTAVEVHHAAAREIQAFLQMIFVSQGKTGGLDPEAVEMAARDVMHRAGAAVLSQLLDGTGSPAATNIPRECGRQGGVEAGRYVCPSAGKTKAPGGGNLICKAPGIRRGYGG